MKRVCFLIKNFIKRRLITRFVCFSSNSKYNKNIHQHFVNEYTRFCYFGLISEKEQGRHSNCVVKQISDMKYVHILKSRTEGFLLGRFFNALGSKTRGLCNALKKSLL